MTLWTIGGQAPLSIGFSRQEYWSGLLCSILGYLPDPGIEPTSPALQADTLPVAPPGKPWWGQSADGQRIELGARGHKVIQKILDIKKLLKTNFAYL